MTRPIPLLAPPGRMSGMTRRFAIAAAGMLALTLACAPAASAQLPFPAPPEVEQALEQARSGSLQTENDLRTSAGATLESLGITPPPGLVPQQAVPAPPDPTPQSPCPRTARRAWTWPATGPGSRRTAA